MAASASSAPAAITSATSPLHPDTATSTSTTLSPSSIKVQQSYAVTWEDKNHIIISVLSFIGFICYGYFACGLGASIPLIAQKLDVDETDLGILFTARGFGFMFGTLLYTVFVTLNLSRYIRNELLISISVAVAGVGSSILLMTTNIWIIMMVVFVQGFVFAGIDIIANILLPNLWKGRVQPWLQCLHACWSLGGIIGPAIIGSVGYYGSNATLMILCFIPIFLFVFNNFIETRDSQSTNLKSLKYLFQLGEVHKTFQLSRQQKSHGTKNNYTSKNSSDDGGDDDDDDDDYDTGIQIRPLQENKTTSSNYVSSSSPLPCADPFDDNYYSHAGDDLEYDGDEENFSSSPKKLTGTSPPESPKEVSASSPSDSTPASTEDYWILPNNIRVFLFLFYFIYVGLETGYGGWIPTYAIERSIAKNDAEGAYLASIFFFAISAGRLAAIPLAAIYTPNFLLRIQLSIVIFGMILVVTIGTGAVGYSGLAVATAVLGYGVSCIFPLGLSVTQDFQKLLMDERSISICMIGAVTGEAIIPVLIGVAMNQQGVAAVLISSFTISSGLVCVYLVIYKLLVDNYPSHQEEHRQKTLENEITSSNDHPSL